MDKEAQRVIHLSYSMDTTFKILNEIIIVNIMKALFDMYEKPSVLKKGSYNA